MQSSQIERQLRGMIDAETRRALEEDERRARRGRFARFFARKAPAARSPKHAVAKGKSALPFSSRPLHPKSRRSDLMVAALGITLGFGCAAFPWYIFFNQEKFGVRAMQFGGTGQADGPIYLGDQGERVGAPLSADDIPPMKLDLFATGTPKREPGDDAAATAVSVEDQPFPADFPAFKLVYVANGRAMISDDSGLWVVQPGSMLPDNSQVARIEQRAGNWVIVTSADKVVELTP